MNITLKDLDKLNFYTAYLRLINSVLSVDSSKTLHPTEIKVLAYFLCLDHEVYRHKRFSSLAKKKVVEMAKNSGWNLSRININNKLQSAIRKGYLRRDEDGVIYFNKLIMKGLEEYLEKNAVKLIIDLQWKSSDEKK